MYKNAALDKGSDDDDNVVDDDDDDDDEYVRGMMQLLSLLAALSHCITCSMLLCCYRYTAII